MIWLGLALLSRIGSEFAHTLIRIEKASDVPDKPRQCDLRAKSKSAEESLISIRQYC